VSNDNGFLYKKNEKGEWSLGLPSTFDMNGKNYLEDAIKEAHDATAHGGVEKTLKWSSKDLFGSHFQGSLRNT